MAYPCPYRDKHPTGRFVRCLEGCATSLPVLRCELFGECTYGNRGEGIEHCCRDCPERPREAAEVVPTRPAPTITVDPDILAEVRSRVPRPSDLRRLMPFPPPVPVPVVPILPPPPLVSDVVDGEIVLNMGAGGLGDGIQGLLVSSAVKAAHPGERVVYRVGPKTMPFVSLFDGYDVLRANEWDRDGMQTPAGTNRQLNRGYGDELKTKSAESRIARYLRNAGVAVVGSPKLREPDRVKAAGADLEEVVLLCPFTNFSDREWPLPHWLELERLLTAAGYRVVVLHDEPTRARPFTSSKLIGQSPERVAGAMLNAACVVGQDSGLSHLAGLLDVPTLVLCGPTRGSAVFGCYPSVWAIDGPLGCSGCYWQSPHEDTCKSRCPSMAAIPPVQVLAAVDTVCLPAFSGHRSLNPPERLANLRDAVLATNGVPGDLGELGVFRGGTAKLIRRYAKGGTLRLFDTFTGIPEDDTAEGGHHKAGEFAADLDDVRAFVGEVAVAYHPGLFPADAPNDRRYRFVHLDCDIYQSTLFALEYFRGRMVKGSTILLDDVGWHHCPGVQRAAHEVFGDRVERVGEYQAVIRFPA